MDGGPAHDPFDITATKFSHYQVGQRIGAGGMGLVYEAVDLRLGRRVALKVLPPWSRFDDNARARFLREAKAASSLNHPNICTIYEYDDVEGRPLIAMEFIEGVTLQQRCEKGPVPLDSAIEIVAAVAAGLAHAHERDIIHRDMKPGNILLGADGRVKIVDFGLARLTDTTTLTQTGSTLGTVAYMSPEQVNGDKVSPKTDVWSLGVVLFEALTGTRPFRGDNVPALIYQILNTEPDGLDALANTHGEETATLVKRCLNQDPSARPTAVDIAETLGYRVNALPSAAGQVRTRPFATKARRVWTAVGAAAIVVALGLSFWMSRSTVSAAAALRTSTLAILPPVVADSALQLALRGLVESSTRSIAGPAVERSLVGQVAPFLDEAVGTSVESARDADAVLGVRYAIATGVNREAGETKLRFSLIDTKKLDTLGSSSAVVNLEDIRGSRNRISAAIGSLIGLTGSELRSEPDRGAPVSPGAADFYNQGLGLLQLRSSPSSVSGAIKLFGRAIDESPDFAAAYAELGRAYLIRFQETKDVDLLSRAERLCDSALEMDPQNESVHITLGQINLAKGQYGLAGMEFDRAANSVSYRAEALLGKARVFVQQGQYNEAERMFKQAIAQRPDYWPGYRELALFYYYQGRYNEAVSQFEIVAKLAPLNPLGYRGMGSSYYNLEEFELARTNWEKALDISEDYSIYSNLGTLNFFLEDYAAAAAAFEKALALDSTDYIVWSNLAMAYYYLPGQRPNFRRAALKTVSLAEKLLDLNPKDDFVRARLAGVHIKLGDTTRAKAYLEPYTGDPAPELTGETVFEIATAWEALGDRDLAFKWLNDALARGYSQTELLRYPGLADLRKDPRFLDLIKSIPKAADRAG